MDPLNKQERKEAFIKMLVMFIITVIIIAIPMYYAFKLPLKELAFNRSENEKLTAQIKNSSQVDLAFLALADSARTLFNQYSNESVDLTRQRISDRFSAVLNAMEDYAVKVEGDTIKSNLYDHVVNAMDDLFTKAENLNDLKKQAAQQPATLTDDQKMIELIKNTLKKHNGNTKDAAKELGMTERRLKKKMQDLGM